ncbi:DUF6448 family protein [Geomonas sp. RF6]|uniref:DUF6448 family protein n=1 Tax=Geomonas sp. RF6 TaxID=2897342 RepID=UPI001E5A57CE|nr:DUF6448 family protein [Geomonas sp. RF6]UFS71438.1 DUF6448 family protein [Geomonas sp. RF6]
MRSKRVNATVAAISLIITLMAYSLAAAHCDTLDGPVVQDARRALAAGDVTPVLKWVPATEEKSVQGAFKRALAARGTKGAQAEERRFFEAVVGIHRAAEGAAFTGLKPAGEVEPVIALADKALAEGKPDEVISAVNAAVKAGIVRRYQRVAEAQKHKDESVQKGREYVAAYVDYTHYIEHLQHTAERLGGHEEGGAEHDGDAASHKRSPKHQHEN